MSTSIISNSLSLFMGVEEKAAIKDLTHFIEYAKKPNSRILYLGEDNHIYLHTRKSEEKISKKITNAFNHNFNKKKFVSPEEEIKEIHNCARNAFFKIMNNAANPPTQKDDVASKLQELTTDLQSAPDSHAKTPLLRWILTTLTHWTIHTQNGNLRFRPLSFKKQDEPKQITPNSPLIPSTNQNQNLQHGTIKRILELGFDSVKPEDSANRAISVAVSPQSTFRYDINKMLGEKPSAETRESAARLVCEFYQTVVESKIESRYKPTIVNSLSLYALQAEREIENKGGKEELNKVFAEAGVSLPSEAFKPSQSKSAPALH